MQALGTFCEFKYGKSLPDKSRKGGAFPVYGSNGIVGYHDEPLTKGATIIVGRKGSAGALQYSSIPCCPIDTTYYVDQTCTKVDLRWLFFTLQNLGFENLNKHVAVPGLNRNDAYEKKILVPPLDEQKRIAAVLDKADGLRRLRRESLQLTEKLLESVFIDMFGYPVTNSKQLPTVDLSQLAKLERGKFTPRPRGDPSFYGGGHPFIQTGDIARSKGRVSSWTQTLNAKGAAVSKEFAAGTVVIAIVGATLGETAILEIPVYCTDSIIGISPFPNKATPEFIEFLLRLWKPRLKELAPDAARANLNLERLRPLQALAPSVEEQEEFSRVARHLRSLVLEKEESALQIERLFSSIQQCAFQGELDLSRLKLDAEVLPPVPTPSPEPVTTEEGRNKRPSAFQAPPEIEQQILAFEKILEFGPGDSIPWSKDYFKYRVLGQRLQPPFSFAEIWEQVFNDMPEAEYDRVKDVIFEYVANGTLQQFFKEERKEIVFEPRA